MATTNIDTLFGARKLFIKPDGATEWSEIEPVKDSITLGEMKSEFKELDGPRIGCFEFSFQLRRLRKRDRVKMGQFLGYLKRPKCTYRTVRHDCAKRNRRWMGHNS